MPKLVDLTGKKFGFLTVIQRAQTNTKSGHAQWECKCDCGNTNIIVSGSHLRSGHTQSCGCLQKKIAREVNFIDITNQQFGALTAIKNIGSNEKGGAIWQCRCKCGNTINVVGSDLRSGHTQSCGCVKSLGEAKIIKLLIDNNINFQTQKTFIDCRFDTGGLAKFDFWVDEKYLIEYDGVQHFDKFYQFGKGTDNFRKSQDRDSFKNEWCKNNKIPLIRIPYTMYENLKIEDLMLETTKCRVV